MAKKRVTKVDSVKAVKVERSGKPVRLDLPEDDFGRLEDCAKRKGLTKSSFARMAVLELIRRVEAETK